jgi:hypothetical protein
LRSRITTLKNASPTWSEKHPQSVAQRTFAGKSVAKKQTVKMTYIPVLFRPMVLVHPEPR